MGRTCYCSCADPGGLHSFRNDQRSPFRESQDKRVRGTSKRAFRDGRPELVCMSGGSLIVQTLLSGEQLQRLPLPSTMRARTTQKSIDDWAGSRYGLLQKN